MHYFETKKYKNEENSYFPVKFHLSYADIVIFAPLSKSSPMKKLYLLFSFFPLIFAANAQDFSCHDATLFMSGPSNATLTATADIKNISSQSFDVICEVSSMNLALNHQKYFCFGLYCYD